MHTALSADAGGGGTKLLPRDAYRFARGEQVVSNTGQPVKLSRPLDFYMITDHSDGMGVITDIFGGAPDIMADPVGREFHDAFNAGGEQAAKAAFELTRRFSQGEIPEALNYQPGNPAFRRVWDDIIAAAEEFNDPGRFTTFIAFEWTSLVSGSNLHRNVIFRDGPERAGQIEPYTTTPPVGSRNPRDLWAWLQNYEDKTGGDVLAIPHNGNLSNGMMFALQDDFADGAPLDATYAAQRQKWERLYEASQIKGDGEAHPLLSPTDEFADFETWDMGNLDLSEAKTPEMLAAEYLRSGLQRGLMLEAKLGVNPFKFGLVGASDTHTGLTTPDNDNFFGKFTAYEPNPERANHLSKQNKDNGAKLYSWQYITAGLTAVWATENTRGALFDAMERREVYATTGPRIRVRLFGGWGFEQGDAQRRDLALVGYRRAFPWGRTSPRLPKVPRRRASWSMRCAIPWAPISTASRSSRAGSTPTAIHRRRSTTSPGRTTGSRARTASCRRWAIRLISISPAGPTPSAPPSSAPSGADPDFDPALRAFYYARVIEIPTPRWTAYDRVKFKLDLPPEIPLKTQERAYTSPIWYTPKG